MPPGYMTVKQAAAILEKTPRRVRQLCEWGELDAEQVERVWLISEDAVQAYKAKGERQRGYPKGRPRTKKEKPTNG